MPGIRFILVNVFFIGISQDFAVYAEPTFSDLDYEFTTISTKDSRNGQTSDAQSSGECFCTYDSANSYVRARVGSRLLKAGDRIMRGETASFECRYVSSVLRWENGLRFFGRVTMTCTTCDKWEVSILPTCKPAVETETVLGYEEDLAVLPGGTVELQKGQSYHFFCSNVWWQPGWIYGGQEGVSVRKTFIDDDGGGIYVSHLDIIHVKDEHSGIYECFSRRHGGPQTLSTLLNIKVVDKSEERGTSLATFPTKGVLPSESTTPKPWENPDMKSNSECACVYNAESIQVMAQMGDKMLKRGDSIMPGETVSFECENKRRVLFWKNSLRYQGKAQMTCGRCEEWSDRNLPTCRPVSYTRNIFITSKEDLRFLSGGILYIRKGESLNITCFSGAYPSQWKYETKENIREWKTHNRYHESHLEIKHANFKHKGIYECISETTGSMTLQLEVEDSASCSKHLVTPGLQVVYSGGLSVGSISTFSCSFFTGRVTRITFSVCQEDGTWSNAAPKCEDPNCSSENLIASLPENMVLDMPNVIDEYPPGSEVRLKCENSIIEGNSKVLCGEHGQWKMVTSRCVPGCLLDIDPSSNLLVHPMKDSYRFGEFIFLSCPPSYRLSNTVERVMCLTAKWSHALPECIQVEESSKF